MVSYADTGFLISLYLPESTTSRAEESIKKAPLPIGITPLTVLEFRNALNFGVLRNQITSTERDLIVNQFKQQIEAGFYQFTEVSQSAIYEKAMQLSDCYTPTLATRSLDLIHLAAALLSGAKILLSFDERQRKVAREEGLKLSC